MFFVSADYNKRGNSGEQHEYHKGGAHRNEFGKDSGKKFAGKSSDGVEHKERAVEAPFYAVRNVGLGCGNADVVRSYAKNSDHEASDHHCDKRGVKIESLNKSDADIYEKRDFKFLFRRKFCKIMNNSPKASSDYAED